MPIKSKPKNPGYLTRDPPLPQTSRLKQYKYNTNALTYSSEGESISLSSPASTCHPHSLTQSLLSPSLKPGTFHLSEHYRVLTPPSDSAFSASLFPLLRVWDYIEHTWVIQANPALLKSADYNLNSTCNFTYPLPCTLTYSQVPGIGFEHL